MSVVPDDELQKLNDDIKAKGYVDREHLMNFLKLIPTSEAKVIIQEVKDWLQNLNDDPKYDNVIFPQGDISAVLGDLDSYGRVSPDTILEFKQSSNKVVPQTT